MYNLGLNERVLIQLQNHHSKVDNVNQQNCRKAATQSHRV